MAEDDDLGIVPDTTAGQAPAQAPEQAQAQGPHQANPDSDLGIVPDTLDSDLGIVPDPSGGTVADYSTPEQELKTAIEGAGEGVAGGAFTALETKILGVNPQDIINRAQENPIIHGASEAASFGGSMLLGVGEAGLFAKVADAATETAKITGIGAAAVKGAIAGGLFQGSDEISKALLGQGDPQDPVSSALLDSGAASLMGLVGGGLIEGIATPALQSFAETQAGTKISQFLSDMGDRLRFRQENPDLVHATQKQAQTLFDSMEGFRDEVYGSGQLKAQNIVQLTEDITPEQVGSHLSNVQALRNSAPKILQEDDGYQNAWNTFDQIVNPTIDPITLKPIGNVPSPADVFQATDNVKRSIQRLANFGYTGSKADVVAKQAAVFSGQLADTLENTNVWGDAGTFQKELNSAVSNFIGKNSPSDIFRRRFIEQTGAGAEVSPGRINTYLNQIGKPGAEIKQEVMQNYVDGAERLQQQLDALHAKFGVQSPSSLSGAPATNLLKATYGKVSAGQSAADSLFDITIPKIITGVGGTLSGTDIGYKEGGLKGAIIGGITGMAAGALAPQIQNATGVALRKYALPGLIRALSSGAPESAGRMLNYTGAVAGGAASLYRGIEALFQAGGSQAIDAVVSSKQKDKLREFVNSGEMSKEIQKQQGTPAKVQNLKQAFAEGGEVKKMFTPDSGQPAAPVLKGLEKLNKAMPEQAMLLAAAKTRVNGYLNSVRPNPVSMGLPFDKKPPQKEQSDSYEKALDLAIQPLSVLNHIKAGTLTPELMKHFMSLWPEIHGHMAKRISERIAKAQMDEEHPTYKTRQSMSLFLGAPLDSTLTPQAIQSIQAIYAAPPPPVPPGVPPKRQKKNTSKLGDIPKDHYTQSQAAAGRATAWD